MNELHIPTVARVQHEGGSHVEPPLDREWSNDEKLAWHAGVVAADTGANVRLQQGVYHTRRDASGEWELDENSYSVLVSAAGYGRCTSGPHDFHSAWQYLNGLSAGLRIGARRTDDR